MTMAEKWRTALSSGMDNTFSPSGHALAVQPPFDLPLLQVIKIYLASGDDPLVATFDNAVTPLAWASDAELVYRDWGYAFDTLTQGEASLRVLSVESGESRPLMAAEYTMSVTYGGDPGHLSVLAEPNGQPGLFDLNVNTGEFARLSAFDAALERLEIYPLFGHAFCHARQEVALLAWPLGEYLPDGTEPTRENSRWSPSLDDPAIQDIVDIRPDGTQVTQRELTREAKRKTPYGLFLLDAMGECRKVLETHKEHRPAWSPDGLALCFERHEHFDPLRNPGSAGGVWLMRRADLSLSRVGGCSLTDSTIMHPSGVLICDLEDESIPFNADKGRARPKSRKWTGFALQDGVARPEQAV